MAIDPMALVQESRPKSAVAFVPEANAMRRRRDTTLTDSQGQERSVSELSGAPGTANFKLGVGNPPCAQCNQDHNPIKERLNGYDHTYVHPDEVGGGGVIALNAMPVPVAAPPVPQGASPSAATGAPAKRISIFTGRGDDDFVLVVERYEDNDWEDDHKSRLTSNELAPMLPVLRALGVKIKDRTGGDLTVLAERDAR